MSGKVRDAILKEWVMLSLAKKWKDFKAKVKEKWFETNTIDARVIDEQFEWLRRFWGSKKAKVCI